MVFYALRGGLAEWLKAAVLKTVKPKGFVGSNPTASARRKSKANSVATELAF